MQTADATAIIQYYILGEHRVCISFAEVGINGFHLIPSYEPFREQTCSGMDILFHLHVDDSIRPVAKEHRTHIRDVDTGNGKTIVHKLSDNGYQFIIQNIFGNSCCLLQTNSDFTQCRCALNGSKTMRTFGLNNALMLAYAFAGSRYDTILLHASLVRHDGWAYAFTAKSGTGKSTQVGMWLRHIPNCDLMNDDNPIVRIIDDTPYIYGSPWSGKTPCYRNIKEKLGAITRIIRSQENKVVPASPIEAFTTLLTACSTMKWDHDIYKRICNIVTKIIETTPNYNLYCRPDKESAIVCHKSIVRSKHSI